MKLQLLGLFIESVLSFLWIVDVIFVPLLIVGIMVLS